MSKIIDLLIDRGYVKRDELNRILASTDADEPPHRVAIITGLVSEEDFLQVVSEELHYPMLGRLPEDYDPAEFERISPMFMEEHRFIPLGFENGALSIAIADPFDHMVADTLKKLYTVSDVDYHLAKEERIRGWIASYYLEEEGPQEEEEDEEDAATLMAYADDVEQLKDLASEAPIIKKVNFLLTKAVEMGSSDVHIEALSDRLVARFRVDGILQDFETLPKHLQQGIATRIKIMAKLDIAERRLPQDGRIYLKVAGKSIDLRVSFLPTTFGESVVMRILDRSAISLALETMGFPDKELEQFTRVINNPYGIVLVTGPTGSGKTTTLYGALNTINSPDKKIITIEDPVEYNLDRVNQVQVNLKAGLTFATGLRSIVRQDPDVILIGEIRDRETADIAIQSALTGHLVFSTLHTNDSAGAVTRLIEIGVEDYLLASSLLAIMAQRLVRLLCPHCKVPHVPDRTLVEKLRLPFMPTEERPVYEAGGCKHCSNSGYRGRTAIFELLEINDEIKQLILENKSSTAIRDMGVRQGMTLLKSDGWEKVRQGRTTITEVLRVAGHQ